MSPELMTKIRVVPTGVSAHPGIGLLQRKCACGNHTVAGGECESCRQKRLRVQRRSTGTSEFHIVSQALHAMAQPFDSAARRARRICEVGKAADRQRDERLGVNGNEQRGLRTEKEKFGTRSSVLRPLKCTSKSWCCTALHPVTAIASARRSSASWRDYSRSKASHRRWRAVVSSRDCI